MEELLGGLALWVVEEVEEETVEGEKEEEEKAEED